MSRPPVASRRSVACQRSAAKATRGRGPTFRRRSHRCLLGFALEPRKPGSQGLSCPENSAAFWCALGCFSLRSALASIWRMRSRVTENCWPTSSSVWSVFMPMPKRMRSTRSSRGVSDASTRVVVSRRFDWIAASIGRTAFLSSMKSPRCESSSSPIGVSRLIGSLAIFRTLRTFSSGIASFSESSSGVGSRPISCSIWREVRTILLIVSIMWTGMRIVLA